MVDIIKYFFNFILFFSIFILIILIISDIYFKEFKLQKNRMRLYGLLLNLTNSQILSITLATLKAMFIMYCLVNTSNSNLSLIFILAIVIIYNIHNLRVINIFIDVALNIVLYLIIISKDIFFDYLVDVEVTWPAISLYIATIAFGLICSFAMYLEEVQYVIKKNKFIKAKENYEILQKKYFKSREVTKLVNELKGELGGQQKK